MQDFVIALFENSGQGGERQTVDVRALLDAGVARADTELAQQPLARAELIGLIARLRSGLGDDEQALALVERQRVVLDTLGGAAPVNLRLDAAAMRAHGLRQLGRADECLQSVGHWRATAREVADAWPQQSAEFLSQLGRCHAEGKDIATARDLFREARKLREGLPDGGALVAESGNDLAMLRLVDGTPVQAVRELRTALGRLRDSGGEQNALGVEIWRNLGAAYAAQPDAREAEAAFRQALEISLARFGSNHPRTTAAQSDLAGQLLANGKLGEAEQLLAQVQEGLEARWGAGTEPLAAHLGMRGMVALERDAPAQAEALLSEALKIRRDLGTVGAHAWDLCHLAQAQSELGRPAEAEASRADCLAALQGAPPASTQSAIAHMANASLDRADANAARGWVARLPPEAFAGRPELALLRARLALVAREPDAGAQIDAVLAGLTTERKHRRLRWQAQSLQAAQACISGRRQAGVALREQTLAEVARVEPEHRRQQRRLALLAAPCG
jgi:tetratricopeptide (TPR) repeat protein